MQHLFIVNPIAGGTSKKDLVERITEIATEHRMDYSIHVTQGRGEAEYVAKQHAAQAHDLGERLRVYSCGGDGTLNEIINGLRCASHTELAVVPVGSGNDFVRSFDKAEPFLDLQAQFEGDTVAMDILAVNSRLALNLVNVGIDALVARNMGFFRGLASIRPELVYPAGILASIFRPLSQRVRFMIDGEAWQERRVTIMVAANGAYYGGGFFAAPFAQLTDGAMELCMMSDVRHWELPNLLSLYKQGVHVRHPVFAGRLLYRRARRIHLRSAQPMPIAMDGETSETKEMVIQVVPAAMKVVVPRGARLRSLLRVAK